MDTLRDGRRRAAAADDAASRDLTPANR